MNRQGESVWETACVFLLKEEVWFFCLVLTFLEKTLAGPLFTAWHEPPGDRIGESVDNLFDDGFLILEAYEAWRCSASPEVFPMTPMAVEGPREETI
jgi:hypothetical protein